MTFHHQALLGAATGLTVLIGFGLGAPPASAEPVSIARFEGGTIDLTEGWGEARACITDGSETECFRSEAELLDAEGLDASSARAEATCEFPAALYAETLFGGAVLYVDAPRASWINLSTVGFNNITSSFTIGACDARLAESDNGGGSWYATTDTIAWALVPTIASGWDNRISSIYLV